MTVISSNLKMTELWFANIFFSFFPSLPSCTSYGCYLLSSVVNLACVTLILQWGVKSASPSSLPHPFLTSLIHSLHSLLFTLKSVKVMEFVWEGVEPPLLYPSAHLFTSSQPPFSVKHVHEEIPDCSSLSHMGCCSSGKNCLWSEGIRNCPTGAETPEGHLLVRNPARCLPCTWGAILLLQ